MVRAMVDRPTHHRAGDAADLGLDGLTEIAVVGSGGSSTVYRARQDELDRTVAVKVVHAAWSLETRERFDHERRVTGRLSGHVGVVPIFETGMTARGEPYLLMPFYPRGSLFRLMRDRGPLPWREATFLVEALTRAVADCHDEGIVHRDIKPGNVMLTRHLQPRIADFGITLPVGGETAGSGVAYTPSYSPPEAFGPVVARPTIDVYGLGATLWALLAGRAPFTEADEVTDGSVVMARAEAGKLAPPAPSTPAPLVDLIDRAMAVDPERRPADAGELGAELRRAIRLSEEAEHGTGPETRSGLGELAATAALGGAVCAGLVLLVLAAIWALG